jgi:hypothetical protein
MIGKWTEQTILKEEIQMSNKHINKCSPSPGHKENANQNDTEISPRSNHNAVINKTYNRCWWGCGEKELLHTVGKNVN